MFDHAGEPERHPAAIVIAPADQILLRDADRPREHDAAARPVPGGPGPLGRDGGLADRSQRRAVDRVRAQQLLDGAPAGGHIDRLADLSQIAGGGQRLHMTRDRDGHVFGDSQRSGIEHGLHDPRVATRDVGVAGQLLHRRHDGDHQDEARRHQDHARPREQADQPLALHGIPQSPNARNEVSTLRATGRVVQGRRNASVAVAGWDEAGRRQGCFGSSLACPMRAGRAAWGRATRLGEAAGDLAAPMRYPSWQRRNNQRWNWRFLCTGQPAARPGPRRSWDGCRHDYRSESAGESRFVSTGECG